MRVIGMRYSSCSLPLSAVEVCARLPMSAHIPASCCCPSGNRDSPQLATGFGALAASLVVIGASGRVCRHMHCHQNTSAKLGAVQAVSTSLGVMHDEPEERLRRAGLLQLPRFLEMATISGDRHRTY